MKQKKSTKILTYCFLILALIMTVFPLLTIVITAMRSNADLYNGPFTIPTKWNIKENLYRAWTVGRIGKYFWNSIYISLLTIAAVLAFATLAGYAFAKIHFKGRELLFNTLLIGMMVPFQAIMIPVYFELNSLGLLNSREGEIILLIAEGLPFGTYLMRSFIHEIPNEITESAKIDGCGEFRIFFSLSLPLTMPACVTLLIFEAMWSWNNFVIPLLLIYKEEIKPVPLGLMYFQGRYTTEYTVIAMAMLITMLPLIVLYVCLQRRFTVGITAGALKG